MKRIIRHYIILTRYLIQRFLRNTLKFTIPNLNKLVSGKILINQNVNFFQKTLITGDGNVEIGSNCSFGFKLGGGYWAGLIEIQPRYKYAKISFGNNVAVNNNMFICAANSIEIGDETLIGQNVSIFDHEAHEIDPLKRRQVGEIGKVKIANNVWIGNNVTILKNSEIGENSLIAAGAVVSGKFPANVIIGGIPARIIKSIHD
jgi:hypothetical protein